MQSEFPIGTSPEASLSPRVRGWHGPCCAPRLCVRPVLFCAGSSVGSVGLLPFPARCRGTAGELQVSPAPPLPRGTAGLPCRPSRGAQLPSPCYSSYLFIEMSECGEVQKSKLAPECP